MPNGKQIRAAALAAGALVLIAIAVRARQKKRREGFASPRAISVFNSAKPIFDKAKGSPQYSEYRVAVPGADPVQFDDLKTLWKTSSFTPENIDAAL